MKNTIPPLYKLLLTMFVAGLLLFVITDQNAYAQNRLQQYIDSARVNNPGMIQLQKQIQLLELGKKSIRASYQAPTGYISSEVNVTPYLNNHGQLISPNPDPNAIGYDINISNGGLYSALMNVDIPLFAKKATQNALFRQDKQIEQLKISYKTADLDLKRQVTDLYLNTLASQMLLKVQQQRVQLLSQEVQIMKRLTEKGMYRLIDFELLRTTLSGDSIQLHSLTNAYQLQLMQLRAACGINNSSFVFLQENKISMMTPTQGTSLFLQSYVNDSTTAVADNRVFNNRYLPQVTLYSNAGLNAVALNGIERKVGASAGIRLSYTLFDGKQKKTNEEETMVRIDQAQILKKIQYKHILMQRSMLRISIAEAAFNLNKQEKLKENYQKLMDLYRAEVQKGQVRVPGFLLALRNYNDLKLSYELQKIKLYRLINEYNYWNN
ncbi:MAG: TolC family protein [Bacteroidales bacterium]|nr:TolC family protein [Bacteroidales bacterium]